MCYHPALLQTGWEILAAKYTLSFTTTIEAPFSLALEPKLTLWKYLMAHIGKTLLIILQPSGINVQNNGVEAEFLLYMCKQSLQSCFGEVFASFVELG